MTARTQSVLRAGVFPIMSCYLRCGLAPRNRKKKNAIRHTQKKIRTEIAEPRPRSAG